MSITKSYNKHTDTYYAYDTTYVWNDVSKKKVQKKVCIGKFDPKTGEIVPNGKKGRPLKKLVLESVEQQNAKKPSSNPKSAKQELLTITDELDALELSVSAMENQITQLKDKILSLSRFISEIE